MRVEVIPSNGRWRIHTHLVAAVIIDVLVFAAPEIIGVWSVVLIASSSSSHLLGADLELRGHGPTSRLGDR